MSLILLGCRCSGSEPRLRTFLRENSCQNWQTLKVTKGKEACLNLLNTLPATDKEIDKLKFYLKRASSWSVILGTDGTRYEWVDMGHMNLKEKLDAEILVERYK